METQRIDRKRKLDQEYDSAATASLSLCDMFEQREAEKNEGWDVLHSILEKDVLQAKIPNVEVALSHLTRWFRIIAHDTEKMRLFRQWVIPSSPDVKQDLAECTSNNVSSSIVSSSITSSSLSTILNKTEESVGSPVSSSTSCSSTGSFTTESNIKSANNGPQVLLQQLLQQQQQQIVILQQLQKQSPSSQGSPPCTSTIRIFPKMGVPSTLLTANVSGGRWHPHTSKCGCYLGFTAADGTTTTAQRIPGGGEGDMKFIVPYINTSTLSPASSLPMVVHLTPCASPQEHVVSLEQFLYITRERSLTSSSASDEDSESMGECEEDGGSPVPQALPPHDVPHTACPTPKQMMSIRERMMDYINQRNGSAPHTGCARLTVLQQPSVRVVWKNRRLDVPFKLKVECSDDSAANGSAFNVLTPSKLFVLAIMADHKGRLQIDAAENFAEEFSTQGIAHFSNLRMTKGTWGKEWSITFAAVVKSSINNPVVVGVSTPCPIVVKTRKNPQIRHNNGGKAETASLSPTQPSFVERKIVDTPPIRAKRNRVEDLLDNSPSCPSPAPLALSPSHSLPPPRVPSHFEDMASLLAAAELKQQEQKCESEKVREHEEPADIPCLPLMTKQSEAENPFTNFQNLMNYLEDIRSKRQISMGMLEQPQPKRDSKVLIVKKGKPFRVPFQVQLRSTAARHNPQHYVCVAVVRNDKGEEVAVRNNEVPFDWRGIACFAGLMVMKGTWGKTVQLTFEARWSSKGKGVPDVPPSWTTQRMLVVSETAPIQLMCYTKDKKSPTTN